MAYQITLSEQDYATLTTDAAESSTNPERLLHDMIHRLQPSSQRKRPLTAPVEVAANSCCKACEQNISLMIVII
jgi:hypothetical protein